MRTWSSAQGIEVGHIVVLGHAMCGGVRSLMTVADPALHGWCFGVTRAALMGAQTPAGPFRRIDTALLPSPAVGAGA